MATLEPIKTASPIAEKPVRKKSGCMKFFVLTFLMLLLFVAGWVAWIYYIPFASDGVRSGLLNSVMRKGNIFKTYEGVLIQDGIRGANGGGMQSNTFEFSIEDKHIFETLKSNSGKRFELQYKEYRGALPWRGNTRYIVDSILNMTEILPQQQAFPVQQVPVTPSQQIQPQQALPPSSSSQQPVNAAPPATLPPQ